MAASNTDLITDTRNAARPNSARVSSGRSAGGATLACDNLTGWPTTSKVHFVTYQIDSNSNPVAGTQLDCYGIRSGNNITSLVVVDGTDAGNAVNDVVEMLPTAQWGQDLATALTAQHSRVGAHVGITNTGGLTTDTLTVSGISTQTGTVTHTGATTLTGAVGGAGYSLVTITNPYKFLAYRSTGQSITAATITKVQFDTKVYDTSSNYDATTNYRFTAPAAGFYQLYSTIETLGAGNAVQRAFLEIYKNGAEYLRGNDVDTNAGANTAGIRGVSVSGLLQAAANDYFEIYVYLASTNSTLDSGTVPIKTYFGGYLVSAT